MLQNCKSKREIEKILKENGFNIIEERTGNQYVYGGRMQNFIIKRLAYGIGNCFYGSYICGKDWQEVKKKLVIKFREKGDL